MLGACGTISSSLALRAWVHQSDFPLAVTSLRTDALHAASVLRQRDATSNELHTVCAILNLETLQANASLPSPDQQATVLLSHAYDSFGAAAVECYDASSSPALRATSLNSLGRAVATLSEATARVATASTGS